MADQSPERAPHDVMDLSGDEPGLAAPWLEVVNAQRDVIEIGDSDDDDAAPAAILSAGGDPDADDDEDDVLWLREMAAVHVLGGSASGVKAEGGGASGASKIKAEPKQEVKPKKEKASSGGGGAPAGAGGGAAAAAPAPPSGMPSAAEKAAHLATLQPGDRDLQRTLWRVAERESIGLRRRCAAAAATWIFL